MTATPQEIYQRYIWSGAITRDADALAGMFTADGIWEAPLAPAGSFPRRLEGRDQIRTGMAAYHQRLPETTGRVDISKSRYVLLVTVDPDVFIAEADTILSGPEGTTTTISLVQIFRIRDGKIALLRDYFAPEHLTYLRSS